MENTFKLELGVIKNNNESFWLEDMLSADNWRVVKNAECIELLKEIVREYEGEIPTDKIHSFYFANMTYFVINNLSDEIYVASDLEDGEIINDFY